jgi:phosphoglycerate dehydrogenase-like enzyme
MKLPPPPSELLLLSPRAETDPAFEELRRRLESGGAGALGAPVRVLHGDGSNDPPPRPGAALVSGGQPEALTVLASLGGEGWRWVHLTASGPDPLRDWPALPGNPLVTYSRGVNARSVAEWCLAAILHFYRDFDHYGRAAGERRWDRRWARELSGDTLVVLGAGSAGSELARLASALGMRTVGVSLDGAPLPGFDQVFPPEETDRILPEGDVTVILLPLTPETRGSFGVDRIESLKEGSLLLVASRGGIVFETGVVDAVRRGRLRGAAFDVFGQEPLPADSQLWRVPGILVTPHVAGTTDRFMERTARILETIVKAAWGDGNRDSLPYYRHGTQGRGG